MIAAVPIATSRGSFVSCVKNIAKWWNMFLIDRKPNWICLMLWWWAGLYPPLRKVPLRCAVDDHHYSWFHSPIIASVYLYLRDEDVSRCPPYLIASIALAKHLSYDDDDAFHADWAFQQILHVFLWKEIILWTIVGRNRQCHTHNIFSSQDVVADGVAGTAMSDIGLKLRDGETSLTRLLWA